VAGVSLLRGYLMVIDLWKGSLYKEKYDDITAVVVFSTNKKQQK
jgi:hypothetical protein